MPSHILIAVICVCVLSIYIGLLGKLRTRMDRYVRLFLGCLLVDALHVWFVRGYLPEQVHRYYLVPYSLLYGPFLFFGYQIAAGIRLRTGSIMLHTLPFTLAWLVYAWWLVFSAAFESSWLRLNHVSYVLRAISLTGYAAWSLFFKTGSDATGQTGEYRLMSMMSMLLTFIAAMFLVLIYSGTTIENGDSRFAETVVLLTKLSAAVALFIYVTNQVVRNSVHEPSLPRHTYSLPGAEQSSSNDGADTALAKRYQKSAVSGELLQLYEDSLGRLMQEKHVYLDDTLSLASLAQQLKMPKHHLSQLFSQRIGKSFSLYINELRVNHAIRLMHAHPEKNINVLFEDSGFTAKASFNRYFRLFTGTTPTAYRDRIGRPGAAGNGGDPTRNG